MFMPVQWLGRIDHFRFDLCRGADDLAARDDVFLETG